MNPTEQIKTWARDPVAFAKACIIRRPDGTVGPIELSPRQESVLRALAADYKTVAVVWPKRSGKTLLAAIALLFKSLAPDRQSVCLANSREQAQALTFDMAREILERTPAFAGRADVQRNEISFPWGSRILVMPCNSRTCAGIGVTGLLVTDESWAADSEEPYHLLASQAEGADAQVMLVSQASGRTKYLYDLWQMSKAGDDPSLYFDYLEPEELGVTSEQIAAAHPNPYIDAAFIESRRKALPGYLWGLYWLNIWGTTGTLLDGEDVEACFSDQWQEFTTPEKWQKQLRDWLNRNGHLVEIGAGLDRSLPQADRDLSVWTVVARVTKRGAEESHFHVLRQTILPTGAESEVLAEHKACVKIFGKFPSILETYQSADLVDKISGSELGTPSAPKQQELFNRLARAVRDGRLHIPATCTTLRKQLFSMEIDLSKSLASFGAPGQAADDAVYSLVWSMSCADHAKVGSTYRPGTIQPVGGTWDETFREGRIPPGYFDTGGSGWRHGKQWSEKLGRMVDASRPKDARDGRRNEPDDWRMKSIRNLYH